MIKHLSARRFFSAFAGGNGTFPPCLCVLEPNVNILNVSCKCTHLGLARRQHFQLLPRTPLTAIYTFSFASEIPVMSRYPLFNQKTVHRESSFMLSTLMPYTTCHVLVGFTLECRQASWQQMTPPQSTQSVAFFISSKFDVVFIPHQ